jgi:sugar-specific transcriptional regulator TrmB
MKGRNIEKIYWEKLCTELNWFAEKLGFPERKRKLLIALVKIKSGDPAEIAKEARQRLDRDTYEYIHQLAKEIEGIKEEVIPKEKKQFYHYRIDSVLKVLEGLSKLLVNKCDEEKKEIEEKRKEVEEHTDQVIKYWREFFERSTGVEYTVKSENVTLIETAEGVINIIDSLFLSSKEKVYFLGGSGKRTKSNVIRNSPAKDIKIILSSTDISKPVKTKFESLKNQLRSRFDYKLLSGQLGFAQIRLLIADNVVLIFKWDKLGSSILWGFRIEDEELAKLLSEIFTSYWNKF